MRGVFTAAIAVAGSLAALFAARRCLVLVNVVGDSMRPALRDGDRILVRRSRPSALRRGDVVVFGGPDLDPVPGHTHPEWHVKRVAALPGEPAPESVPLPGGAAVVPEGTVVVLGDNPVGGDSRHWGPYPAERLLGTLVCRVRTS